jgi:hypothetical protein
MCKDDITLNVAEYMPKNSTILFNVNILLGFYIKQMMNNNFINYEKILEKKNK